MLRVGLWKNTIIYDNDLLIRNLRVAQLTEYESSDNFSDSGEE